VEFEGPGTYGEVLEARGYELTRHLVPASGVPADLPDFLLVMGGPMSANDTDPWIGEELTYIRKALEHGVAYLGTCLGSQLLARAVGGSVYPGPLFEAGPSEIRLTPRGQTDPAFSHLPPRATVCQWHGEGVTVPEDTVVLASSPEFPVQAFRYARSAYGLLFHLELAGDGIDTLCANCPRDLTRAGLTGAELKAAAAPLLPQWRTWAEQVLAGILRIT
jgi:GMP synthase-like glutamine amidotransferase